eukprot:Em0010g101a
MGTAAKIEQHFGDDVIRHMEEVNSDDGDGGCHMLEVETDDSTNEDEHVLYTDLDTLVPNFIKDLIQMTFLHQDGKRPVYEELSKVEKKNLTIVVALLMKTFHLERQTAIHHFLTVCL